MRWLALMLAGCAFQAHAAEQQSSTATIVDDTAADFMAGQRTDVAIDPLGLLVPEAFIGGGLHARSYPVINNFNDTLTWDTLGLGAMIGERYGESPVTNWGGDRPYSLGLTTGGDYFTVTYEGEIYLPAGPTTLQLEADDQGFIEIDLGTEQPILRAHYNDSTPAQLTVTPAAAGWYPIRGVEVETYGTAFFLLKTVDNSVATLIDPTRLRARVTDAHGITVVGTPDRIFGAAGAAPSIEPSLVDRTFNNTPPSYDFYGVSSTDHVLRYAGQLRVDTADTYTFTLDDGTESTHHARLFVDGAAVAGSWPGGIDQLTSDPVMLAAGWHDLIADFSVYNNSVDRVSLTASTSTTPAAPIPTERLRPVRTTGFVAYSHPPDTSVASDSSAMVSFKTTAPAGSTIDFTDLFAYITGATRSGLAIQLAGTSVPVPATPPFETYYDNWPERTELAGMPADGTYAATFTTTGTGANLQYLYLFETYHGGPDAPFAPAMTYVSGPHVLDGTVTAVRAIGELHGAQMTVEIRTGDAASIDTAPWVAPDTAPTGDIVEYRLTITGDGWQYPAIDRVEIDVLR